jgi:hypothetical protein
MRANEKTIRATGLNTAMNIAPVTNQIEAYAVDEDGWLVITVIVKFL